MFSVDMGKTSNRAKQQWNSANYTQIKVQVKPETASSFKAACAASETSMASELSAFMDEFANPKQNLWHIKVKTLEGRRKAIRFVIGLLTEIKKAEQAVVDNTPENLQGTSQYESAEERLDSLSNALDAIDGVYDQ